MTLAWLVVALALAWVAFAYAGYPALIALLARLAPRPLREGEVAPSLSVVIAVHDGAHALKRKLEQTLALAYPKPVQVIVASDGSTDATDEIARGFAPRVELVRNAVRAGKEAAQGAALARATGDVVVFTDVTAELAPDALGEIVRPFADPSVGCVSSEDRVETEGGEGAYVRLEMALRRFETRASSLVGLSGSCFAARRDLCAPVWPSDLASDFRVALEAARRGLRAVSAPRATACFRATDDAAAEWRRKVRTVRRGLAVLAAYRELLHPRHGRVALSLWGHKVARFTTPFALLALLAASAALAPASGLGAGLLAAQLLAYGVAAAALALPAVGARRLPRLAGFFLLVNASMLVAWGYHLTGRRAVTWDPTRR